MNDESLAPVIAEAIAQAATVTVTLEDGRSFSGTLKEHATDPGLVQVRTGRRGRPPVFAVEDVAEVSFE